MSPRRTLSSTTRPSAAREWLLFGAAALLPTLGLGALGLRALRNEEAAIRREAAVEIASSAQRAVSAVNDELSAASEALSKATFDDVEGKEPAPKDWIAVARALAPRSGSAIVLTPSGNLAEPSEPGASAPGAPTEACKATLDALATATGDARAEKKREIVAACPEAKSSLGRWLWPTLAIESLDREPDAALAARLAAWLRAHASGMRASERSATAAEIAALRGLDDVTVKAMSDALAGAESRFESLARAMHGDAAVRAARSAGRDVAAFRGGGAVGALRPLRGGWLVGFVVTPETLEEALAASPERYGRGRESSLEVVRRGDEGPQSVHRSKGDAALVAVEWIADGLGVKASLLHPEALLARTSRSEAWLAAIAIVGGVCAVALAAFSFARMRAARRTSELRTSFVAAVSHELRTPIASVRMLAELLEEGRVDDDERAEVHEALAKEARRLGETVDRLLGFSRMAADKIVLDRAVVALAGPVARATERFRERNPDIAIETELDESVLADLDASQVELIVDNLLGNAKKYAPAGAPYRVVVARVGNEARVSVADRGPGIARRDQRRIFEAFERVDDRLSKATEGSGIGLSLVLSAARAHGGDAWVESEPGRGAEFVVSFPAALEPKRPPDGGER